LPFTSRMTSPIRKRSPAVPSGYPRHHDALVTVAGRRERKAEFLCPGPGGAMFAAGESPRRIANPSVQGDPHRRATTCRSVRHTPRADLDLYGTRSGRWIVPLLTLKRRAGRRQNHGEHRVCRPYYNSA
jgi:hypothetical protein